MKLEFIGTGSAFNTKLGNTSAYLKEGNKMLLIDCGSNVFQRIKENNLLEGIDEIYAVITHTHADHVGSLADLVLYSYFSHGEFAKCKINVYYSDGVEVDKLLNINGCVKNLHYKSKLIEEGQVKVLFNDYIFYYNKSYHVGEIKSYSINIINGENYIHYSGDSNEISLLDLSYIKKDYLYMIYYIDTCAADYEGNVHLSLRKLKELVPEQYRHKIWCMHLDEGFDVEHAKYLGFNVVESKFNKKDSDLKIDLKKLRYNLLDKENRNSVHDVILSAILDLTGHSLNEEQIAEVFQKIPDKVLESAKIHGWDDTEFRDTLYGYVSKKYFDIIEIINKESRKLDV